MYPNIKDLKLSEKHVLQLLPNHERFTELRRAIAMQAVLSNKRGIVGVLDSEPTNEEYFHAFTAAPMKAKKGNVQHFKYRWDTADEILQTCPAMGTLPRHTEYGEQERSFHRVMMSVLAGLGDDRDSYPIPKEIEKNLDSFRPAAQYESPEIFDLFVRTFFLKRPTSTDRRKLIGEKYEQGYLTQHFIFIHSIFTENFDAILAPFILMVSFLKGFGWALHTDEVVGEDGVAIGLTYALDTAYIAPIEPPPTEAQVERVLSFLCFIGFVHEAEFIWNHLQQDEAFVKTDLFPRLAPRTILGLNEGEEFEESAKNGLRMSWNNRLNPRSQVQILLDSYGVSHNAVQRLLNNILPGRFDTDFGKPRRVSHQCLQLQSSNGLN